MKLYEAACNCDNCRENGWRVRQWILTLPVHGGTDIVLREEPPR